MSNESYALDLSGVLPQIHKIIDKKELNVVEFCKKHDIPRSSFYSKLYPKRNVLDLELIGKLLEELGVDFSVKLAKK